MLPTLLVIATLAQDGPVLAPPADAASIEFSHAAPEAARSPSPDRRAALRRILQPRPAVPQTVRAPAAPASKPATPDPTPTTNLDALPEPLELKPAPRTPPTHLNPSSPPDPFGLDELPPELQLQPAPDPNASAPSPRSTPRNSSSLPLEVFPENPDDSFPSSLDSRPDPSPSSRSPSGRPTPRRPRDDHDDDTPDLVLERQLRKTILTRLGRQLRDVDVRVRGERVSIRADVNFFWNRRAARRAIESLPELAGYQLDLHTY